MTTSTLIGTLLIALFMGIMVVLDTKDNNKSYLFDDEDFDK